MAKQSTKYYVVWIGYQPGIYKTWNECQKQVSGFDQAKFKSFKTYTEAETALKEGWKKHWGKESAKKSKIIASNKPADGSSVETEIDYDSISVDVGTRGNPGPMEYKGVDTRSSEILFHVGPVENGTNNLGEFVAIVHALAYLKKMSSDKTVYTDSKTALSWLRKKKTGSSLVRDESTKEVWKLVDRAVYWLENNNYKNKVMKWDTENWGEIKADFGRK